MVAYLWQMKGKVASKMALLQPVNRPYLGALEGGKKKAGPVRMGCIYKFHLPDLRYVAFFVIFRYSDFPQ